MKNIKFILITILALGCNNQAHKEQIKKVDIEYISSYYKNKIEDKIEFSRIVRDSSIFYNIEGEITLDENYNTIQKIISKKIISESEVSLIKDILEKKDYRDVFDTVSKVIFVQLQIENDDFIEVLELRHSIENKIHNKLNSDGFGAWIAGDLGPGGANMLFEVTDWDKAIHLTMEILENEGVLDKSLITKRLNLAEDDWNYEIIYPIDYNGVFYQM